MFTNDILPDESRARAFNFIVPHYFSSKKIPEKIEGSRNNVVLVYDFRTGENKFLGVFTLNGVKKQFKSEIKEKPLDNYDYLVKQFNINNDNFYIWAFFYGPHGTFQPSLYGFSKENLDDFEDIIIGEQPETSKYNPWFSDKVLKSSIKWEVLSDSTLEKPDKDYVIQTEMVDNNITFYIVKLDDLIDDFNKFLVPKDAINNIKKEYEKSLKNNYGLLIFNTRNYLEYHTLLVKYEKNKEDKYDFTFIPSPGDSSLEEEDKKSNKKSTNKKPSKKSSKK